MFKVDDQEAIKWTIPFMGFYISIQDSSSLITHESGEELYFHCISYHYETNDMDINASYTNFNTFGFKSMEFFSDEVKGMVKNKLEQWEKDHA